MQIIRVRNAQQALPEVLFSLEAQGVRRESRNGPVIMFPEPVTTMYTHPRERVMFWPERDANPFFHLFEALWMLGGREDVAYVANFAKRMSTFSDNGTTLNGAYGFRWRRYWERDQINIIIDRLRKDPNDRRCVLQMWDARYDLGNTSKDVPCNTNAYFSISNHGKLDMTVCNRSNDIVWGAYGANVVHFSVLQEYIATCIGVNVGWYWQMSNNLHAYVDTLKQVEVLSRYAMNPWSITRAHCHYSAEIVAPYSLMGNNKERWDSELQMFLDEGDAIGYSEPFFRRVAIPMLNAHRAHKRGDSLGALRHLSECHASDWALAAEHWIRRRIKSGV